MAYSAIARDSKLLYLFCGRDLYLQGQHKWSPFNAYKLSLQCTHGCNSTLFICNLGRRGQNFSGDTETTRVLSQALNSFIYKHIILTQIPQPSPRYNARVSSSTHSKLQRNVQSGIQLASTALPSHSSILDFFYPSTHSTFLNIKTQ